MIIDMKSLQHDAMAVVIGASGSIGAALAEALQAAPWFANTICFNRASTSAIDLYVTRHPSLSAAAMSNNLACHDLIVDATGLLHGVQIMPEKSWRGLDPKQMAQAYLPSM